MFQRAENELSSLFLKTRTRPGHKFYGQLFGWFRMYSTTKMSWGSLSGKSLALFARIWLGKSTVGLQYFKVSVFQF